MHLPPHAERIMCQNVTGNVHVFDTVTQGKVVYLEKHQRKLVATGGLDHAAQRLETSARSDDGPEGEAHGWAE